MLKRKKRKNRKSILIDKKQQPNAEQLLLLFETIENIEIKTCEMNGVIRVEMPEKQLKMEMRRHLNMLYKSLMHKKSTTANPPFLDATARQISGIMIK